MQKSVQKFMLVPEEEMIRKLQLNAAPTEAKMAVNTEAQIANLLKQVVKNPSAQALDVLAKKYEQLQNKYVDLRTQQNNNNNNTLPITRHQQHKLDMVYRDRLRPWTSAAPATVPQLTFRLPTSWKKGMEAPSERQVPESLYLERCLSQTWFRPDTRTRRAVFCSSYKPMPLTFGGADMEKY